MGMLSGWQEGTGGAIHWAERRWRKETAIVFLFLMANNET